MAECKSCGKTYFSKSCPHCNSELVDSVLGRTEKKSFSALIITLLIFASIGLASYVIAEFISHQNTLENAKKQAALEKQRNIELQREKERLAQKYRYQKKQNNYKSRYSSSSTMYKPKLKSYRHDPIEKKIIKNTYQPRVQPKENRVVKNIQKTKTKRYTKYSDSIKLKSSSKITVQPDNRLASNAPIYGSFKGYFISDSICGEKYERDLGLHKECYVKTISYDKLYFSKSRKNEFDKFRNDKAFIECNYNKKHGVMQDCKIWKV